MAITRWIAGGGALAGAAGIFLSETLLSPTYEILYSGGMSAVHCGISTGEQACTFIYDFSIGNTGKEVQETVRVTWPVDMRHWGTATQVADIVGSARKTQQPQIQPAFDSDKTVYTISGLMPNTMVSFKASCYACAPAQLQAMRQAGAKVEARGTTSEGDPRVSALMRGFTNMLRVVGLFG